MVGGAELARQQRGRRPDGEPGAGDGRSEPGRLIGSQRARSPRARRFLLWGITAWLSLVAVWLTWTPFELVARPNIVRLVPETSLADFAGNLFLLVPFGIVVALGAARRPVLRASLLAALLSIALELGQIWTFGRIVSAWDVVLNTTGAAIAAHLAARLRSRVRAKSMAIALACTVYVAIVAYVAYAWQAYAAGMRLARWDGSFEIVAGDESGGKRRYIGEVARARICAGEGAGRLCAGPNAAPSTRNSLVLVAERTQVVEIEAAVRSGSSTQSGPTRIVTFSSGPFDRNVTLGQEGESLVLRLRTPMNGPNGRSNELVTYGALPLGVPISIRVRYDHAKVTTRLASTQGTRTIEHIFDGLAAPLLVRGQGPVSAVQAARARRLTLAVLAFPFLLTGVSWVFSVSAPRVDDPLPPVG